MARRCHKIMLPGGGVALITVEERGNPNSPCEFCVQTRDKPPAKHEVLCDFPIRRGKGAKLYTCSRKLCKPCALTHGDLDFCPTHAILMADHSLTARLVPLLDNGKDREGHRVALDMIDQVLVTSVRERKTEPERRFVPKGLVDWHEFYTERAAMYEYQANMPREDAERRARADAGPRPLPTPEKKR